MNVLHSVPKACEVALMSLSFQLRNSSLSEPNILRFPTHLLSDSCFRPVWFDGVRTSIARTVLSMPSTAKIIFSKFDTECLIDSTIVCSITVVSVVLDKVDTRLRISSRPAYAILEYCDAPSAAIAGAEGRRQGGKGQKQELRCEPPLQLPCIEHVCALFPLSQKRTVPTSGNAHTGYTGPQLMQPALCTTLCTQG